MPIATGRFLRVSLNSSSPESSSMTAALTAAFSTSTPMALPEAGFFGMRAALRNILNDEKPMIIAAASITIHAGDIFARCTPKGLVHAPAKPHTMPSWGMHVLFLIWVTKPTNEVGMMANSEVAVEARAESPKPKRNRGTIKVPPPIPSKPDKMPTTTPTAAVITKVSMKCANPILR